MKVIDDTNTDYVTLHHTNPGDWYWIANRSGWYGGKATTAHVAGVSFEFAFEGPGSLAYRADRQADHGSFAVTVDGKDDGTYSGWDVEHNLQDGDWVETNQTLYTSPKLGDGQHVIRFTSVGPQTGQETGSRMVLDSFVLYEGDEQAPSGSASMVASSTPPASANSEQQDSVASSASTISSTSALRGFSPASEAPQSHSARSQDEALSSSSTTLDHIAGSRQASSHASAGLIASGMAVAVGVLLLLLLTWIHVNRRRRRTRTGSIGAPAASTAWHTDASSEMAPAIKAAGPFR